ncbi:MAG: hypothetical protein WCJ22_06350, partial [Actinomycetes bacterium]
SIKQVENPGLTASYKTLAKIKIGERISGTNATTPEGLASLKVALDALTAMDPQLTGASAQSDGKPLPYVSVEWVGLPLPPRCCKTTSG